MTNRMLGIVTCALSMGNRKVNISEGGTGAEVGDSDTGGRIVGEGLGEAVEEDSDI